MLALGALVLAYISVTGTLANVIARASPQMAHELAWKNGRLTAALALHEFSSGPDTDPKSEQARLAIQALQQDPTVVDALSVLALQAQLRSEGTRVEQLFRYSFALSRRELQPQIWAIEKAVQRGDIDGALGHYDLALRASRRAQSTLFPVLAFALSEPRVREALLGLLVSEPVWGTAFVSYASVQGRDLVAIAELLRDGSIRGLKIEGADQARVVNRMVVKGLIEEAWSFYESFRPDVRRTHSRNPNFDADIGAQTVFDWKVGRAPGLSAAIVRDDDGGFLDFAAPAGTRAVVVSQTQLLPPGLYRIEGGSEEIDQPTRSRPYWTLVCQTGAELGRVNLPNSATRDGRFSGEFVVPPDCPQQTLVFTLRASDKASGASGQIQWVQLSPAAERQ